MMKKVYEVSKLAGISRRTLQFYDEKGILPARRSKENYRLYDEAALERLWQILCFKEMGFELDQIKKLVNSSELEKKKIIEKRIEVMKKKEEEMSRNIQWLEMVKETGMPSLKCRQKTAKKSTFIALIHEYEKECIG